MKLMLNLQIVLICFFLFKGGTKLMRSVSLSPKRNNEHFEETEEKNVEKEVS